MRENLLLVLGTTIPSSYMEEHKMDKSGIVITGWLSAADKHALHTGAWLFVGASEAEGFGMTIAESLAHNTPTIVADSTAQRELITERGFRFMHSNNELAGLVTALWHNPNLYHRCKLHTVEMAGRLDTWDTVAKRLTAYLT
jgi:glycosyltransferase involved in cell wall biosynthesis